MKTQAIRTAGLGSALLVGLLTLPVHAGEMIYEPLNPSFGGDPFMGSYMLNKAQSQDTNTDPNTRDVDRLSSTDRLIQSLESRLISELLSDVGDGSIDQGSFDSDEFGVVVDGTGGELVIRINDKLTGDTTEISVGGLFNP